MYMRERNLSGLGVAPVVVAASLIQAGVKVYGIIKSIFGHKPWNWSICDPLDRHLMAHIFNVFYVTAISGGYDRIKFWMDKVVDASGNNLGGKYGWAAVQTALQGGNWSNDYMFGQMGREAYLYGTGAGLTTAQIMQIFLTEDPSIDTSGTYYPPASLVAIAQVAQTDQAAPVTQKDQASIFSGFLPIALIGGAAYLVAKKMRVI